MGTPPPPDESARRKNPARRCGEVGGDELRVPVRNKGRCTSGRDDEPRPGETGLAAVPYQARQAYVADPTGASFVFSLLPTAARYPLKDLAKAIFLGPDAFAFTGCLTIFDYGGMSRSSHTYAVPADWAIWPPVEFTGFEVWRVAL